LISHVVLKAEALDMMLILEHDPEQHSKGFNRQTLWCVSVGHFG